MSDFASLLDALNPEQRSAVTTTDGPLLVIAGAGSGKTRVITHRIANLICERGVAPWQIFAATFTNKAADEMRHRIERLLPGTDTARLSIATFHSLCVSLLRREGHHLGLTSRFSICDDTDQIALIKDCQKSLTVTAAIKPELVRNWITSAKILMLGPEEAMRELGGEMGPLCGHIYARYQERLLANDAVDFDDLLLMTVRLFKEYPEVLERYQERWRYIMVDEYQDTNRVQFEFVRLLAAKYKNICVVGDEDQSIYSWRGAEIENLLNFPKLFEGARIIRLEQNYRSTETILQAASAVIAHNTKRLGKNLWSERGQGQPITVINAFNEREEATQVVGTIAFQRKAMGRRYSDMAIFYRVNALSRVFEDQLRLGGIPYRVIGGIKFYDRAEIKDLLAYLRLAANPRDGVAMARVINRPTRGIGDKSLGKLFGDAATAGISLWEQMELVTEGKAAGISKKARAGMIHLAMMIRDWGALADTHPPHEMLERILRDTDYETALDRGNEIETVSRRENIGELISALEDFHKSDPEKTLSDFLERVALVNAQDALKDDDAVSLMTLHCAKGLEYPLVFMVGMEEPIFPSQRAVSEQGNFEEERRLFYVGITRAQDLLFFSRADSRMLYGRPSYNPPSLFLREVPADLMRSLEDARRTWGDQVAEQGAVDGVDRGGGNDPAVPIFDRRGQSSSAPRSQAGAMGATTGEAADDGEGLFPAGARVSHERLGEGLVVSVSGSGARRKIDVQFDAGLRLEILEQFGGLTLLPETDMPF